MIFISNIIHYFTILTISLKSIYYENTGGSWKWRGRKARKILGLGLKKMGQSHGCVFKNTI